MSKSKTICQLRRFFFVLQITFQKGFTLLCCTFLHEKVAEKQSSHIVCAAEKEGKEISNCRNVLTSVLIFNLGRDVLTKTF